MSARAILREVMSAQHDLVEDCDTDAVSVTSTDAGSAEPFYTADCIIAENPDEERCYLVKWEDWPLHDCTWEPPAHLDGSNLISNWEQVKQELGDAAFRHENAKNIAAFERALERAEAAKERRHEKREKKRRRLSRQRRSTIVSDEENSDEEPLNVARVRLAGDQSLFVDEQEPSVVRQFPVPRRELFQQSSFEGESDSDGQASDDSLPGELQKKKKKKKKAQRTVDSRPLPASSVKFTLKPTMLNKTESGLKTSKASANSSSRDRAGNVFGPVSNEPTAQRKTATSTTVSKPANVRAPKPNGMQAIRTAPQKQTSRAIKIIDQPREKQRKLWSTDNHYHKVHFRGLAEKRSRTEGTPDFNELNFVHGPPPTLPKSSASSSTGNLYGRREITNRRIHEDDPEDRPRQGSAHSPEPLADWEVGKVPQMCASWRLSRNCPYGPQRCRFMHRSLDPGGREYPLGDINGWVPYKYRNPPITCPYWYKGHCTKSPEQCTYAHKDTGWAEVGGEPIRIHLLSEANSSHDVPPHLVPYKFQDPPITCTYWLRGLHGCIKSDEVCKYAHWNTGWAPPETDIRGQPVRIDLKLRPRGGLPKYADPPITCPHWLRSEKGCTRADDECKYAHRNTGWAPGLTAIQPEKIDPKALPQSVHQGKKVRSESEPKNALQHLDPKNGSPPITCYFWLRHAEGCAKSAEACKFAHVNTGWISQPGKGTTLQPNKIDPLELPRSQKLRKYPHNNEKRLAIANCPVLHLLQQYHGGDTYRGPLIPITDPPQVSSDDREKLAPTTFSRASPEPDIGMPDFAPEAVGSDVAQTSAQQLANASFTPQAVLPLQLPTATTSLQLSRQIEQYYSLEITEMFGSGATGDYVLERRAMLLYHPEEHSEDLELITRWLLMHKVEVGNLWYDGAWGHFQQEVVEGGRSGIIIVHPDFEQYTSLSGFGEVLKKSIRVWSVGLQPPLHFEPRASPIPPVLRHDCVPVFLHGGFIYITDEVFDQKPQLAVHIVKLFFAKIEQLRSLDEPVAPWYEVEDACLLWRLCVRPELMEYLFQKCADNAAELAAGNPDDLSRAELYQLLTLTNYIEQDDPSEASSLVRDKDSILVQDRFPIISERRIIAETQPLDYFNRLANSPEEATARMIEYYAMMQIDMRRDYRQFYVVHTEPKAKCAQQWTECVQTIAEVITPEQCVEELGKDSKESLFDFLDWTMRPKKEVDMDPFDAHMEIETVGHTTF